MGFLFVEILYVMWFFCSCIVFMYIFIIRCYFKEICIYLCLYKNYYVCVYVLKEWDRKRMIKGLDLGYWFF